MRRSRNLSPTPQTHRGEGTRKSFLEEDKPNLKCELEFHQTKNEGTIKGKRTLKFKSPVPERRVGSPNKRNEKASVATAERARECVRAMLGCWGRWSVAKDEVEEAGRGRFPQSFRLL